MHLNQVTSLVDFALFVPGLVRLHNEFASRWDKESTEQDFLHELLAKFHEASVFADAYEDGKLKYFVYLHHLDEYTQIRVFHVDVAQRAFTKDLLAEVKSLLVEKGVTKCFFSTMRVTPSYDRWVKKWGAKQHEIIYKVDLS